MQVIVSTDLDGTLLDHHDYSWQAALPAIQACVQEGIPIICNTSKTQEEVRSLQGQMGLRGDMVVENGSALIMELNSIKPSDMGHEEFKQLLHFQENGPSVTVSDKRVVCIFGKPRIELLDFIKQVRTEHGWQFEGFNDWSLEQIVEKTGLDRAGAESAINKQYSEPFEWHDSDDNLKAFSQLVKENSFQVLKGGRFYHLQGETNKAIPLLWLKQLLSKVSQLKVENTQKADVKLICLGDNQNDVDMLNVADYPVCIRSPVAKFPELQNNQSVIYTEDYGPVAWNKAVLDIIYTDTERA